MTSECWEWNGKRSSGRYRYGLKTIHGRTCLTHRLAYEWAFGPVPNGLMVLHACNNPPCCNPDHLYAGGERENALDRVKAGTHNNARKTHCKNGHELCSSNLVPNKRGVRMCRKCNADAGRRYRQGKL